MRKFLLYVSCALVMASCQSNASQKENPNAPVKTTTKADAPDERGYLVKVGEMAPDFKMQLTDSTWMRLSEQRGKLVMLQFTASWCGVCLKEMPHIEQDIWLKHKNNPNFALFGIDREEPLKTVERFIQKSGVTYPIGLDPKADIFGAYADRKAGITRNVIINPKGEIIMLTRLFNDEEFSAMVALIDAELANMNK